MKSTFIKTFFQTNVLFRLLSLSILLMSANLTFGQNSISDIKNVGDLSKVNWKAVGELNTTLTEETTRINLALAAPNLQDVDKVLFTAYKRLVDYVQVNVQSGQSTDKAIANGYEKVLTEAPHEPALQSLRVDVFNTYIPGLVEVLTAVPQAVIGQF